MENVLDVARRDTGGKTVQMQKPMLGEERCSSLEKRDRGRLHAVDAVDAVDVEDFEEDVVVFVEVVEEPTVESTEAATKRKEY
jgi:hypothetical protein